MVFCECGEEITNEKVKNCPECGREVTRLNPFTGKFEPLKPADKDAWPKTLSKLAGAWGVINLLFLAWLTASLLIFFAILIYITRNLRIIYLFSAIWLLIAIIQLFSGVYYISTGNEQAGWIILLALINFIFAGWVLNENRKQIKKHK